MVVDLHGYEEWQAESLIIGILETTTEKEITVVHGYRNGDTILTFVRKKLKHKKIKQKILTMNPGQTILLLK